MLPTIEGKDYIYHEKCWGDIGCPMPILPQGYKWSCCVEQESSIVHITHIGNYSQVTPCGKHSSGLWFKEHFGDSYLIPEIITYCKDCLNALPSLPKLEMESPIPMPESPFPCARCGNIIEDYPFIVLGGPFKDYEVTRAGYCNDCIIQLARIDTPLGREAKSNLELIKK